MRRYISFEKFWDAYGDAYGGKVDRTGAERAWKRLSAEKRREAYDGIGAFADGCRRSGKPMPQAPAYLNRRRWEDTVSCIGGRTDDAPVADKMEIW